MIKPKNKLTLKFSAKFLVLIITISCSTLFGQSRELILEIQNIDAVNSANTDSLRVLLTEQGFMHGGETLTFSTHKINGRTTLIQKLLFESDSSTLMIYFNRYGFIYFVDIESLINDTLKITKFKIYPDCKQVGTWLTKTIYENDSEGEIDFLNYRRNSKLEFDLDDDQCKVPDSLSLIINGVTYKEVVVQRSKEQVHTTGNGSSRRFWIGKKRKFTFRKVGLVMSRKVKIKVKKSEPHRN